MKKLQILSTGCPKCKTLAANTEAAAKALGLEYEMEKITDIAEIMKFGVMMTPARAIASSSCSRARLRSLFGGS